MPWSPKWPTNSLTRAIRIGTLDRIAERDHSDRESAVDGHLVGSIGEVIAAERFGLTLYPGSHPTHDAVDKNGRDVQIKLTAVNSVAMYGASDRLIVLRIVSPQEAEVVYDGDGKLAWSRAGRMQKNGQRVVSITTLRSLTG